MARLTILLALCVLPAMSATAAPPDSIWNHVERIVAVGDVHGDYGQFVRVLKAAGLVDENLDWSGDKTHLVQIGDVVDKGADSRKCLDLLIKLEPQAERAGGKVHALIGNHEAMAIAGDHSCMLDAEMNSYGGKEGVARLFAPEGTYGKWILTHDAVIRINDVLFCHAGLRIKWAEQSLPALNQAIRKGILDGCKGGPARDGDGPLWDRELATRNGPEIAEELTAVLKRHKAGRMVVGHTNNLEGIIARLDDRLLRIDVGMTKMFGGPAACLLIERGVFYELRAADAHATTQSHAPQPRKTRLDLKSAASQLATQPASRAA